MECTLKGTLELNRSGISLTDGIIKIQRLSLIPHHQVEIMVCIYKNAEEFNDKGRIAETEEFIVSGDDFDTYFAETVVKTSSKTLLTQAVKYLSEKIDRFQTLTIIDLSTPPAE